MMREVRVHLADPVFRAWRCPVKFTLTYDGELKTSQSGRKQQRPALRRHFHRQLRHLWKTNPFLQSWSLRDGLSPRLMHDWIPTFVPQINGISFIPIVFEKICVECALDIRVLRSTQRIGNVADIDNVVKTLLDCLKMPQDADQIGDAQEYVDINPLYTLLQDDKMVTKISSIADEMLDIPETTIGATAFLRVQIDVHLRPRLPTAENVIFFADEPKVWNHKYDDAIPDQLNRLSTNELRSAATQCIFRIHALSLSFDGMGVLDFDRTLSFAEMTKKGREQDEIRQEVWQTTMWRKALAVKQELLRRIYGEEPYPRDARGMAIDLGALAGPKPFGNAANDLEKLVRLLS